MTEGRKLEIMGSADHSTCINNEGGKIKKVIGEVNASGKGSHLVIGLLI